MITGTILKGIGGFYYIDTSNGVYECKARGIFRKNKITPVAGDICDIDEISDSVGNIIKIHKRKNEFIRPPVANIDNMFIVFAAANPMPVTLLIDKLTIVAEKQGITPIIIINKMDLSDNETEEFIKAYRLAKFEVICVSAKTGEGTERIKEYLKDKLSVFAGCSGVGKSSILNVLAPEADFETGSISQKIKRGKNTTREVVLFPSYGGYIADTPGFSFLEITDIKANELESYFREFDDYTGGCRFRGCSHISEPGCAVKEALSEGKIGETRYQSYIQLYDKLKDIKDWQV